MYFSKLLLADIVDYGASKGADRGDLCRSIGIGRLEGVSPQEQVGYEDMVAALQVTGQAIGDENLGLHMGEHAMLKGTEQVDEIMRNSPTVEEAFENASAYEKLISDALRSRMEKTEKYTRVYFEVNPNWEVLDSHAVQQIIDMTLVCALKSIYWLTNRRHCPVEVHLSNPTVKKKNEYYRVFDCSVKFGESAPCIVFRNPTVEQAVPDHDLGLLAYLKSVAEEEVGQMKSEAGLIVEVKQVILKNLPQKSTIAEVASELNLSSRTLQRRLRDLKTSFKAIEKDFLIKLAQKFLRQEERNLDEIGYLLGFSESSALIRFFKSEMQTTPKQYRKLMRKGF